MYILTIDGHFEMLLEMSIEDAETHMMRCFVAHGYKPSYRWLHFTRANPPLPHTIEYGYTDGYDQMIKFARLTTIKPSTSLDSHWEGIEKRQRFPEWEKFLEEARANESDPEEGHYYQCPPLKKGWMDNHER